LENLGNITAVGVLERKALDILEKYVGANNYILRLKIKMLDNPKFYPTRAQSEYIINFHSRVPKVAKKWVDLDPYFAQKIADDKLFTQVPTNIFVEKLLVEKDTSYHIWGKFFESENCYDLWLPKVALIKDNTVKNVEIDYSKYSHRPPLEHQKEAIQKLCENKKMILADDMGLGKTTSTIIAALETGSKKIMIICPASLKINWQREIENYTDRPTSIIEGKKWEDADFVIINYDIIKNFHDEKNTKESIILNSGFDLVVIDEAHYIQNKQAQRTKLINDFASKTTRLWLLTGTPITSRPINYYNLLNLIDSPVAVNWMAYVKRYCNGFQFRAGKRKVWNVSGASNLEELRDRTKPQVLRRLKENVLDLPDKIITPVYLRLRSRQYEELMGDYYDWYDKSGDADSLTLQFTKLTQVRQCIAQEKVSSTIEICENIIEQDKKVIVFTNFTKTLEMILEHFGKKAVRLDGSMNQRDRQEAVDKFQNDDSVKVFVGNIKAAGTGITLTSGEAVVMNDLSFLPSDHSQAEDRAYRYGQKNNVLVYYPIFDNTIEGIIYDILRKKKDIFETVMGDKESTGDYVEEILKSINSRR
jgi:SWI/SNF-related matrix-associated actin-dependent regulator 1 of chromatin subfamily A